MQLLQQQQNNRKQHLIRNNQQSRNMSSTSILHMSSSVDENIDAKEIENNNSNIQPDNSIREKIIQEKVELINELNDPIETQSTKLNGLIEEDQSAVDEIINEVEIINENDDDDDIQIRIDDDSSNLILVINTTSSLSKQYTTNNTTSLLSSESKRTRRKHKKNNPRMQMFAYLSQPSKFHTCVTAIYYYSVCVCVLFFISVYTYMCFLYMIIQIIGLLQYKKQKL